MAESVLDPVDFRNAMARFASGVTVVSTRDRDGRLQAFTASAFSSLSLEPPLTLVCLEKRAHSYEAFMQATEIAISILAAGQGELAWHYARKHENKFDGQQVDSGSVTGLPLIPGATAHLECRVYDRLPGGDHTVIIGEVLRAAVHNDTPLLHFNRLMGRFVAD